MNKYFTTSSTTFTCRCNRHPSSSAPTRIAVPALAPAPGIQLPETDNRALLSGPAYLSLISCPAATAVPVKMLDWKSLAPGRGATSEGDAADGLLHLPSKGSPLTRDDCMYILFYAPTSLEEENYFMEQGHTQGRAPAPWRSLPARRPSLPLVAPRHSGFGGLQEESLQSDNDYINNNRYEHLQPLESALSQRLADNVACNMDHYYETEETLGTDEEDKAYLQQFTASEGQDHGAPTAPSPQPPCVTLYPGELAQGLGLVRAECLALRQSYGYDSGRLMEAYLLMCGVKGVEPGNCSLAEALALPSTAPIKPTTFVPCQRTCSPQPSAAPTASVDRCPPLGSARVDTDTNTPAAAAGPCSCPQPSTPLRPLCPAVRPCCPPPATPAAALGRGSRSAPGTHTHTNGLDLPSASSSSGGVAMRIAPSASLALASRSPACPASPFAAATLPSLPSPCSSSPCGSAASAPSTPSTCISSSPSSPFSSSPASPFASPAGCTAAMDALLGHMPCIPQPASINTTSGCSSSSSSSSSYYGALPSHGCPTATRRQLLFPSPTQCQGGLCGEAGDSWTAGRPAHSGAPAASASTSVEQQQQQQQTQGREGVAPNGSMLVMLEALKCEVEAGMQQ